MTTKERYLFLAIIITVVLTMIYNSANAGDYYYDEPIEVYDVYPTIPGTNIRDYDQPGYHIEIDRYGNEEAYPTIPGTNIRDYNQPGWRIDRR